MDVGSDFGVCAVVGCLNGQHGRRRGHQGLKEAISGARDTIVAEFVMKTLLSRAH